MEKEKDVYKFGKGCEITGDVNIQQKLKNEDKNSKRRFWLAIIAIIFGSPMIPTVKNGISLIINFLP